MAIRRRLTYANVIATLAFFFALGGGAYAAVALPHNSVGAKQIRAGAVRSAEVKDHSLKPGDLQRGGLAGFAYIRFDSGATNTLQVTYGRGVTGVASTGTAGEYDVSFNRKVRNCIATAAPALGSPRGDSPDLSLSASAGVLVDPDDDPGSKDRVVRAQFYDTTGAPRDTSFVVMLIC